MKFSVNKTSLNIFLWALMPIILFSLVGVAVPYLIEKTEIPTVSDKETDWVSTILHNEIEMHKADSVSLPLGYGKLLHQGSVKHLFPDLQCMDLSLSHGNSEHCIFLILYTNNSIPVIVDSLYYKNGGWVGFNMQNGKEIRLGKMIGSPNLNENIIDVPATYINAYIILTLGIILLCLLIGFIAAYPHADTITILTLIIGFIVFGVFVCYQGSFMPEYFIEAMTILFTISEISVIILPHFIKSAKHTNHA